MASFSRLFALLHTAVSKIDSKCPTLNQIKSHRSRSFLNVLPPSSSHTWGLTHVRGAGVALVAISTRHHLQQFPNTLSQEWSDRPSSYFFSHRLSSTPQDMSIARNILKMGFTLHKMPRKEASAITSFSNIHRCQVLTFIYVPTWKSKLPLLFWAQLILEGSPQHC